ncbi:MAG: hypothetical protein M0D57_19605 [Sphingobacteriales bacterium JAD_PAG50586_3]|nr:MAG: hypothetical protein M0D57_19605 [Sphingobacteriales bacterium JAD_PAG50586_3]
MSSKKVVELVNRWAEFEAQYPQAGIEQFCHWVLNSEKTHNIPNEAERGYSNNGYAAQLLSRLARYAHIYSKDILEQHGIESVYEFGFMMTVLIEGKPKKSELIEKQLTGFTSGIGIINRLLKRGLLAELPDETDKRTKRISITPQGFATLQACIPDMEKLSGIVFSPLPMRRKTCCWLLCKSLMRYMHMLIPIQNLLLLRVYPPELKIQSAQYQIVK